jgi:hypothetical protein
VLEGDATISLNQDKIDEESKWDGLRGVITNDSELSYVVPCKI